MYFTSTLVKRRLSYDAFALTTVAAMIVAGCGESGSPVTSTTTDSAGITIVESADPIWGTEGGWHLSPEPTVTIGILVGPEEYLLDRVTSGVRLADGTIVIANVLSLELRFYDSTGSYLFTRGGDGAGPGEFRSMGGIWHAGDSLFVYDFGLGRVSVFSTSGEFCRVFTVNRATDGALAMPHGVFSNGQLLVLRTSLDSELGTGFFRNSLLYLRYTMDGELIDTIGRFLDGERYMGKSGDMVYSTSAPFGRQSYIVPAGERLYYGSSDSYEIEVRSRDGTLEQLVRRPIQNPPVTPEEVEEFETRQRERLPTMRPMWRELQKQMTLPETKPAYGRFLVDANGNLWVGDYSDEWLDEGTWNVFDPEGRWLGPVETPVGGRIFQIGNDFVLGMWRDDLEVERVMAYELVKH